MRRMDTRRLVFLRHDDLFGLVDELLDPLLDFFVGRLGVRDLDDLLSAGLPRLCQPGEVPCPPCVPLGNLSLALSELLGRTAVLLGRVLLVEDTRMLLELLADLALGILGKEGRWAGTP
jgi:hypothetical protein